MPRKPNKPTLSTVEAAAVAQKVLGRCTSATIVNWCWKYGIGQRAGWRFRIDPEKLQLLLQDKLKPVSRNWKADREKFNEDYNAYKKKRKAGRKRRTIYRRHTV